MQKVVFECETVTPMFLAGAEGVIPELRPPSIKGMMRFWWRALNGHLRIDELRKKEADIFGSNDTNTGRSKVNIRMKKQIASNDIFDNIWKEIPYEEKISSKGNKFKVPKKYSGISFLLYSTHMPSNERPYIKSGISFSIELSSYDNEILKEAVNSMAVLALFGGLGSRNRRGAGSFRVKEIITEQKNLYWNLFEENKINSKEDLKRHIEANLKPFVRASSNSSYSILKNSTIYILDPKNNWKDALEIIGKPYMEFRNKSKARILDTPNFGFPIVHKNHILIGAGKRNINKYVIDFKDRRSSPLIFKILKTNDITFFPLIIWLEGELIPSNYEIMDNRGNQSKLPDEIIVDEFLKSLSINVEVTL